MCHSPKIKPPYDNDACIIGTDRDRSKKKILPLTVLYLYEYRLLSSKTCVQGMSKFETHLWLTISAESRPVIFKKAKNIISGHPCRYQRIKSERRTAPENSYKSRQNRQTAAMHAINKIRGRTWCRSYASAPKSVDLYVLVRMYVLGTDFSVTPNHCVHFR